MSPEQRVTSPHVMAAQPVSDVNEEIRQPQPFTTMVTWYNRLGISHGGTEVRHRGSSLADRFAFPPAVAVTHASALPCDVDELTCATTV